MENQSQHASIATQSASPEKLYQIPFNRADKTATSLGEFAGQAALVVNVASRCGQTPQYEALERIHERYRARGFSVLGFPANDFGAQEPGTDAEIQQFCRLNYDVQFPVFAKISVKGESQHPLYGYLTRVHPKSEGAEGDVKWNFEKFLIDGRGEVIARFGTKVLPEDPIVIAAIESALAAK